MSAKAKETTLVIFGASGDLTHRKIGPSLYRLFADGRLPKGTNVVGFARTKWNDDQFREALADGMRSFDHEFKQATWDTFAPRFSYVTGDINKGEDFNRLEKHLDEVESGPSHRLYYLAVAPRFFGPSIEGLSKAGMSDLNKAPGDGRRDVVIEKPFGRDGKSAAALNDLVRTGFNESQVYRIDHYLGKETAQNILYFRFANTIFDPLLNRNFVDNVQISVTETVDVGHRAGYYDSAGVWRDMFQNHLLQLTTLIAMEPPAPNNATTLRNEKVKVLAAARPIEIVDTVAAQYQGYDQAEGVAAGSRTPTFGALKLHLDNWRWAGVPFYLRSGKAMHAKASEITVEFKRPPYQMYGPIQSRLPNVLSICIQPDEGMHLSFDAKVPNKTDDVDSVDLEFHYRTSFPGVVVGDAYERLLLDAIAGDASLFARDDEIEAAWRLMDPVIAAWEGDKSKQLASYARGSDGPEQARQLLNESGRLWRMGCADHD